MHHRIIRHSTKVSASFVMLSLIFKVTVNVSDTKFGFRSLKAELLTESR